MKTVILVNGVPASGKSTTAIKIATHFRCPYLSIDTVKEPFMSLYAEIDRPLNRQLGRAAYQVIWDTIAQAPQQCIYVVDAWFGFRPKAELQNYIREAKVEHVIEVWNHVSPDVVVERYKQRLPFRKKGHPGAEYLPELASLAQQAKPMNVGELVWVEQNRFNEDSQWLQQIANLMPLSTHAKKAMNY